MTPAQEPGRCGELVPILTGEEQEHIVGDVGWAVCRSMIAVFFGWSISVAIRDEGLGTFVPVPPIVVIALLAVLGGVLASRRPAMRGRPPGRAPAIATE